MGHTSDHYLTLYSGFWGVEKGNADATCMEPEAWGALPTQPGFPSPASKPYNNLTVYLPTLDSGASTWMPHSACLVPDFCSPVNRASSALRIPRQPVWSLFNSKIVLLLIGQQPSEGPSLNPRTPQLPPPKLSCPSSHKHSGRTRSTSITAGTPAPDFVGFAS